MFPRVVYHKDYDFASDTHTGEKAKKQNNCTKIVKSQKELDHLGPDWKDHPSTIVPGKKVTPAPVVKEEVEETDHEEEADENPYDDEKPVKRGKAKK